MGTDINSVMLSIVEFSNRVGLSSVFEYLSNPFMTVSSVIAFLLGALVVSIIFGIAFFRQNQKISVRLETLSEAMDEQSRLMEKMRRTLADVMEVLVYLQAATRYRARAEQTATNNSSPNLNASASALRKELELLKAEFSADLPAGPTEDER